MRLLSAVVLALLACGACASTTSGTGHGSPRPTFGSTARSAPSSSLPPPSLSLAPPSSAAVPSPTPVAPPAVCASGHCTKNTSADLGGGYTVTLYTGAASGGSVGSTVLELSDQGAAVFWQETDQQVAGGLACSPQPVPNCVVVAGVGAHASVATGYTRTLNKLVAYGTVPSDTPSTDPVDLNGDGLVDVVTAINTYEPSYATGTVYWQTFQSTGTSFKSTGCTAPQHTLAPEPTTPLTGTCPS